MMYYNTAASFIPLFLLSEILIVTKLCSGYRALQRNVQAVRGQGGAGVHEEVEGGAEGEAGEEGPGGDGSYGGVEGEGQAGAGRLVQAL